MGGGKANPAHSRRQALCAAFSEAAVQTRHGARRKDYLGTAADPPELIAYCYPIGFDVKLVRIEGCTGGVSASGSQHASHPVDKSLRERGSLAGFTTAGDPVAATGWSFAAMDRP